MSRSFQNNQGPVMDRRAALAALLSLTGASALFATPVSAFAAQASAETEKKLSDAQAQYDAVQKKLDSIAMEYSTLAQKQNKVMGEIEDVQGEIDKQQKKLGGKRDDLSKRVAKSYKNGGSRALTLLLSSDSFEELINNSYYVDKINASDRAAIEDIHNIQVELNEKKASLEKLKEEQESQLKQMQSKQAEVQKVLDGLSDDVKQLMEKRDAEILQSAKDEEAQKKAAAQAAKAQGGLGTRQNSSSNSGSHGGGTTGTTPRGDAPSSGSAARVVSACHSTPSPGPGLCAAWVSNVFRNAGFGFIGGNACDMYNSYCTSSNRSAIRPGMIVAVSTHAGSSAGRIYGHIGIYIGNGTVMDNVGFVRTISLDSWVSYYSSLVTPRWGWLGGIALS